MPYSISPTRAPPHKELLGVNAFNILLEKYPPCLTSIDIFEDIVDVSGVEKKAQQKALDLQFTMSIPNI